jgi:hypothetical protein
MGAINGHLLPKANTRSIGMLRWTLVEALAAFQATIFSK